MDTCKICIPDAYVYSCHAIYLHKFSFLIWTSVVHNTLYLTVAEVFQDLVQDASTTVECSIKHLDMHFQTEVLCIYAKAQLLKGSYNKINIHYGLTLLLMCSFHDALCLQRSRPPISTVVDLSHKAVSSRQLSITDFFQKS